MKSFQMSVLLSTLAAAAIFFAASCRETVDSLPPDSDKAMLATFAAHEVEFNRLVEMCQQDSHMTRIAYNFLQSETAGNWPRPEAEWGISAERWQRYNDLFSELGLSNGVIQYYPTTVWMVVTGKGMEAGGSGKGYAHLTEPPKTTQPSLDNYVIKDPAVNGHFAYRPIKDNWYLFVAKY